MPWFCLKTPVNREFSCQEWLHGKAYETFLPTELKPSRRRHAGHRRRELTEYPLFTGYLFVRVDDSHPLWPLYRSKFVAAILGTPWAPLPVPEQSMQDLIARTAQHTLLARQSAGRKAFNPGDRAEIIAGAFQGRFVAIDRIIGRNASVLMQMFGATAIPATVPLEFLHAV